MNYTFFIKIYLIIISSGFVSQYAFAQDAPTLWANNQKEDIHFPNCASIAPISFSAAFEALVPAGAGNGRYYWKLYRNNIEIASYEDYIVCDKDCSPPCSMTPLANFYGIDPVSGEYKVHLLVKLSKLADIGCRGLWVNTNIVTYDEYSEPINVTRPDDGMTCNCDVPFDATTNCAIMNFAHNHNIPYFLKVRNNMESGCTVKSGKTTTLVAGTSIRLKEGFRAESGSYFHAYIEPDCFFAGRMAGSQPQPPKEQLPKKKISDRQEQESIKLNFHISGISIYPNPTSGSFNIILPNSITHQVIINDILGNLIYQSTVTNDQSIDISDHPKGIYFIRISNGNEFKIEKIIHQ